MATFPYAEIIGALLWVQTGTRPDISYAVTTLARFNSNPSKLHWEAILWLLGYLACTLDYCICYHRSDSSSPTLDAKGYSMGYLPPLTNLNVDAVFVDASFAADTDTCRSQTGYVFFLAGGPISWQSRL